MKPSNELHQLIKNLTMSEKRYFKIFSARHVIDGENNYIRLFDAIERQEEYDETRIKDTFRKERFISHLASEKHYLYNHVLDSLNAFHKDRTFLTRFCNTLMTVETLYNKGLFEQCKRIIKKAKVEAYETEKFSTLKLLVRWEILLYIKDEDVKNLYSSFDEELRILEMIRIQSVLMRIAFKIQIEMYKGKVANAFIKEIESELKQHYPPKKEVDSFWARYYYFSSMGLIYSIQNKAKERLNCYHQINNLMQKQKAFIVDLPHIYHTNINNMINLSLATEKYEEVMPFVQEQRRFMQAYKIKNPALEKRILINTWESELFLLYKKGVYEVGSHVIKRIEPELKKIPVTFSPAIFDLLFMMAVVSFSDDDHRGALKWLNKILNTEKEMNIRIELKINTRLLYLIVLYEKEDLFFDNQYQSVRRFLTQDGKHESALRILEMIRLIAGEKPNEQKRKRMRELYVEIKADSKKGSADATDKQFDFLEWIDSKLYDRKLK